MVCVFPLNSRDNNHKNKVAKGSPKQGPNNTRTARKQSYNLNRQAWKVTKIQHTMNIKHKTGILHKTNIAFRDRFITKNDICREIMRLILWRVFFKSWKININISHIMYFWICNSGADIYSTILILPYILFCVFSNLEHIPMLLYLPYSDSNLPQTLLSFYGNKWTGILTSHQ